MQNNKAMVSNRLGRFSEYVTRVEVHLSDRNSDKKFCNEGIRCLLESWFTGIEPNTASNRAAILERTFDGAIGKLARSLDSSLERMGKH